MRRETPSLSISVTPSQLMRWFFRFRSSSALSYLAMTAADICPACQPIKVKSGGRDDLSQYNGAALRWAHGADEFLYQILSAFDCHDFLWG